jgi:hypothetical protein
LSDLLLNPALLNFQTLKRRRQQFGVHKWRMFRHFAILPHETRLGAWRAEQAVMLKAWRNKVK